MMKPAPSTSAPLAVGGQYMHDCTPSLLNNIQTLMLFIYSGITGCLEGVQGGFCAGLQQDSAAAAACRTPLPRSQLHPSCPGALQSAVAGHPPYADLPFTPSSSTCSTSRGAAPLVSPRCACCLHLHKQGINCQPRRRALPLPLPLPLPLYYCSSLKLLGATRAAHLKDQGGAACGWTKAKVRKASVHWAGQSVLNHNPASTAGNCSSLIPCSGIQHTSTGSH